MQKRHLLVLISFERKVRKTEEEKRRKNHIVGGNQESIKGENFCTVLCVDRGATKSSRFRWLYFCLVGVSVYMLQWDVSSS